MKKLSAATQVSRSIHRLALFSAAVNFLGTQAMVERERIGAIGICGSNSFVSSS